MRRASCSRRSVAAVSEDWAAVAAEVDEALGEFRSVTLHAPAVTEIDPATDTPTEVTPAQEHAGVGVESDYSAFSVASGAVAAGDVKFALSALKADGSPMPKPVSESWTLEYEDGTFWTIKKVDRLAPAGVTVRYKLQLRGVG